MPTPPPKGDAPTPQKRLAAMRLLQSGMGYKAVAQNLGLNGYTVRDWMRALKAGDTDAYGNLLHGHEPVNQGAELFSEETFASLSRSITEEALAGDLPRVKHTKKNKSASSEGKDTHSQGKQLDLF